FFQAEDGIRDRNVTGVQTCALPILVVVVSVSGVALGSGVCDFGEVSGARTVSVTVVVLALLARDARLASLASLSAARRSPCARAARLRASSDSARVPAKSPDAAAAAISSKVLASSTKASSEELNRLWFMPYSGEPGPAL